MTEIALWIAVVVVSTIVVWKGSGMLESSSSRLAAHYRLPDVVQGAVVVAVGSSFPELSTTVIAALIHGEFEVGVAAIVGSALFNILVIPALSGLASGNKAGLVANRELVFKEAQFYMIAVATLLLTFAFSAIYNPVPAPEGQILGEMTRTLALIPVVIYGLYLFIQWQETRDADTPEPPEGIRVGKEWLVFAAALLVIVFGVEGLVRAAIRFGDIFETPSFIWGFIVVAAGTSIPDAFVSVRAARKGNAETSLANVLGSNVFDLLVAIPAGVLVAGATAVNFSLAAPMMGILTLATIVLFLLMRIRFRLSRNECVFLLMLYVALTFLVGAESFGLIDLGLLGGTS